MRIGLSDCRRKKPQKEELFFAVNVLILVTYWSDSNRKTWDSKAVDWSCFAEKVDRLCISVLPTLQAWR